MTLKKHLVVTALGGLLATVAAQAQYTSGRAANPSEPLNVTSTEYGSQKWEVDAGLGYLFDTNIPGADDGVMMHIGGYYLDSVNSTHETTLKYGGEFVYGNASSSGNGSPELNTYFFAANAGIGYRFNRTLEGNILAGVGVGGATFTQGNADTSTFLFGFQVRPELTAWITEKVGVTLSYRFFQSVALNDAWNRNPQEHAIEFGVKVRF